MGERAAGLYAGSRLHQDGALCGAPQPSWGGPPPQPPGPANAVHGHAEIPSMSRRRPKAGSVGHTAGRPAAAAPVGRGARRAASATVHAAGASAGGAPCPPLPVSAVDPVLRPDFGTSGIPRRLPRGAGSLPAEVVEATHRARLMNAMAYVVAAKGYAATSVADLTAHAGISRTTFYEVYTDKEDCFLQCFDQCSRAHLAAVLRAADEPAALPQKVWALLAAHLAIADTNPWFARTFIAEAHVATPRTSAASEQIRAALSQWLRAWFAAVRLQHPEVPARSEADFDLVQEAVAGFVVSAIRKGRPLSPDAPAMTRFVFAALGLTGWAVHVADGPDGFPAPTT